MNKHMIEVFVLRNALKQTITYTQGSDALPTVFVFKDYVIPEGTVATIYVAKPSGKGLHGLAEVNVGDNTVTVAGDKQMTAEPGTSYIQLELINEGKTLFTFNQPIMVIKSASPIQSENGMPFIDELIGKLNDATEGVEGAVESANTAAVSANEATEKANAAASGDLSEKTTTYTESTAESPPASGGKLPAIIGWCIGKIKALVAKVTSLNENVTSLNSKYVSYKKLANGTADNPLTLDESWSEYNIFLISAEPSSGGFPWTYAIATKGAKCALTYFYSTSYYYSLSATISDGIVTFDNNWFKSLSKDREIGLENMNVYVHGIK